MPLLKCLRNGEVSEYGFGAISAAVHVSVPTSSVASSAEPVGYDYFLLLPQDYKNLKVVDYWSAHNIKIPEGYGMPALTPEQQLEVQTNVVDLLMARGDIPQSFISEYSKIWLQPLVSQTSLQTSNTVAVDTMAKTTQMEPLSVEAVKPTSSTNASAVVSTGTNAPKLTAKFSDFLTHPLVEMLKRLR